jgi:hypothetical protein
MTSSMKRSGAADVVAASVLKTSARRSTSSVQDLIGEHTVHVYYTVVSVLCFEGRGKGVDIESLCYGSL